MRGDASRPIWIAITFLLALLVGVTMYQLLSRTSAQRSIDKWLSSISADQAEEDVINFCYSWYKAGFTKYPTNFDVWVKASYSAAHPDLPVKYLTEEEAEKCSPNPDAPPEDPATDPSTEGCLQKCDCIVILYKASTERQGSGTEYLSKYEAEKLFREGEEFGESCIDFFRMNPDRPTKLIAESLGLLEE